MDINNIISGIPSIVGSLYENIFLVSKELGVCYSVQYTGEQLKVSAKQEYNQFVTYLGKYKENIISHIENRNAVKEVITTKDNKEKLLSVVTKDNYKFIFIMDISNIHEGDSEKKILLIADDSPVITKFFKKTFIDEYEVLVANNGKEAIELVNANLDNNLVGFFCDLQMPEMNGYEVLEYFEKNNLFDKVPVSIISGEDTADGIEKATAYRIVDMLQKPFNAEAAKAIVNKTIQFSPKNK